MELSDVLGLKGSGQTIQFSSGRAHLGNLSGRFKSRHQTSAKEDKRGLDSFHGILYSPRVNVKFRSNSCSPSTTDSVVLPPDRGSLAYARPGWEDWCLKQKSQVEVDSADFFNSKYVVNG